MPMSGGYTSRVLVVVLATACGSDQPTVSTAEPGRPPRHEDPTPERAAAPRSPSEPALPDSKRSGLVAVTAELAESVAEPRTRTHVDFGPLLGGRHEIQIPTAGTYGSTLRASQRRFLTMERTVLRRIDGGALLTLESDGRAHGCFWAEIDARGTTSRHASESGKHEVREHHEDVRLGVQGRWSPQADRNSARVVLDRFAVRSCVLGPDDRTLDPLTLDCVAVTADALPTPAIVCSIEGTRAGPERVAMLLADTPRDGSWDLREDLDHRSRLELGEDVRPWLLLGAGAQLRILHRDSRTREPLVVTFERHAVRMPTGELIPR